MRPFQPLHKQKSFQFVEYKLFSQFNTLLKVLLNSSRNKTELTILLKRLNLPNNFFVKKRSFKAEVAKNEGICGISAKGITNRIIHANKLASNFHYQITY